MTTYARFPSPMVCPFFIYRSPVRKGRSRRRQISWLQEQGVELVILARYMQILSASFLQEVGCPVINIHHFSSSFAGAKPYHQAYQRGVS